MAQTLITRRGLLQSGVAVGMVGIAGCQEAEPATVVVEHMNVPGEVFPGETIEVDVTLVNEGGQEGTQTVTLSSRGEQLDSNEVTVDTDNPLEMTLSGTATGEAGESVEFTVATEDDSESESETLDNPLVVTDVFSDDESPGTIVVTATVENRAPAEATGVVEAEVTSNSFRRPHTASQEVTVAGDASDTVELHVSYDDSQGTFFYEYDARILEE